MSIKKKPIGRIYIRRLPTTKERKYKGIDAKSSKKVKTNLHDIQITLVVDNRLSRMGSYDTVQVQLPEETPLYTKM